MFDNNCCADDSMNTNFSQLKPRSIEALCNKLLKCDLRSKTQKMDKKITKVTKKYQFKTL